MLKSLSFSGLFSSLATCQIQKKYSLNHMPQTSFTCRDKILGGYYADAGKHHLRIKCFHHLQPNNYFIMFTETNCQMFHICVKVAGVGVSRVIDWLIFIYISRWWCFCGANNVMRWKMIIIMLLYHRNEEEEDEEETPIACHIFNVISRKRNECIFFISFVQLKVFLCDLFLFFLLAIL